jgi:SAM-dependent methyltransferase
MGLFNRCVELGCGTGLLMYPLLPHVAEYVGLDSSAEALERLKRSCAQVEDGKKAKFLLMEASEIHSMAPAQFDVVIINSVVQYFPSADYLVDVLSKLAPYLAQNSMVFVGDVRSSALHRHFLLDVLMSRLPSHTPVSDVNKLIDAGVLREKETLFDPRFFHSLSREFPWIVGVDTEIRNGFFLNEMNKFRFDALLYCKGDALTLGATHYEWPARGLSIDEFMETLKADQPEAFMMHGFPNERLTSLCAVSDVLARTDPDATLGDVRHKAQLRCAQMTVPHAPDWIVNLEKQSYRVVTELDASSTEGALALKGGRSLLPAASSDSFETLDFRQCSNRSGTTDSGSDAYERFKKKLASEFEGKIHLVEIVHASGALFRILEGSALAKQPVFGG